jgi:pantoate--beta-alanine ligase
MTGSSPMRIARSRQEARLWRAEAQARGLRTAFVPTMGALHDGHLSLVRLARQHADLVMASIFVNPTQFSASEDFSTYPRKEQRDLELLEAAGCAFTYCPPASEIYPPGDSTRVLVRDLSHMLEGEIRPHFFEGVATVVSRLFIHLTPDAAIFGEKDYQQLLVIRRMTTDLGLPLAIIGGETAREPDGLAMSSRNAYLTASERPKAGAVYRVMTECAERISSGDSIRETCERGRAALLDAGFAAVDYVEARRADTLAPFGSDAAPVGAPGRLLLAARLGQTRLIDNMAFQRR